MNELNHVNTKQGSNSSYRFSNGNTLPFTQLPFAMAGFVPQTASDKGNWFYNPSDKSLEGIRLSHQPSPWVGDYGNIIIMPQNDTVYHKACERWSGYSPKDAVLRPDYMKIHFKRYDATFELAPTQRGCAFKVEFKNDRKSTISILPIAANSGYKIDLKNQLIYGYTKSCSWDIAKNFAMYFVVSFSEVFDENNIKFSCDDGTIKYGLLCEGEKIGIHIGFENHKIVTGKLAISYISFEQAYETLSKELLNYSFDDIKNSSEQIWNDKLQKIKVKGGTTEQIKTFYSCLYRVFLYPHCFYELDKNNNAIHYCTNNGEIKKGKCYVDNGFWDTFRTVYPLLSIIDPQMNKEIVEGYIQIYEDTGWLPKWCCPVESGIMPGTLIDAIIADAAAKGIVDKELLKTALEGMIKHSTTETDSKHGRKNINLYKKYHYVPCDMATESVNKTLDYAYGDYCISIIADALNQTDICKKYQKMSENYKLLFDKSTGFMRGKDSNGNFSEKFSPFEWGGAYCEGGAYQSTFGVYHDLNGLSELFGGTKEILKKLDELFVTPPYYFVGSYHSEIHEMTEMASADFGQCAISNQPSFHLPFLYAYFGQADKTNYWVNRIVNEAFDSSEDGFPGDEDNGSMSAWYIFACMGLYPLCPGEAKYITFKSIFSEVIINGKKLNLPENNLFIEHTQI